MLFEKDADVRLVDHTKKNLPQDTYDLPRQADDLHVAHLVTGRLINTWSVQSAMVVSKTSRPIGQARLLHVQWARPIFPKRARERAIRCMKIRSFMTIFIRMNNKKMRQSAAPRFIRKWLSRYGPSPSQSTTILIHPVQFPQHSWQSWRSRYLRVLRGKPRPGGGVPSPELVHGTSQLGALTAPTLQPQRAPETQREASHTMSLRSAHPENPNSKRKRDAGPQPPASPLGAAAPSPSSKRRLVEAPGSSALGTAITNPESVLRPHEPAKTAQPISHTPHPSHTIDQPTEASKALQTTQAPTTGPTNNTQEAVDPLFLEMPFLPSSPEPEDGEETDESELPDVDAWIDSQLSQGNVDESTIISVLRSANMDQELADTVLRHWDPEKGIPDDLPGIWTAEDDRCLEGQDARGIQRVLMKHGQDASNSRWEYLRMARERGML